MYFYGLTFENRADYDVEIEPSFGIKHLSSDIIWGGAPEKVLPPDRMDVSLSVSLYYYQLDQPFIPSNHEYKNIPGCPKDEYYEDFLSLFLEEYPEPSITVIIHPLTTKEETFKIGIRDWTVLSFGTTSFPWRNNDWLGWGRNTIFQSQVFTILWTEEIEEWARQKRDNTSRDSKTRLE